jgi:membrane fusion protein, multidrug efflux system
MQRLTKNKERNKVLLIAFSIFVIMGLFAILYHLFIGQYRESTDNAYVQGDVYTITPQTSGVVTNVYVSETQNVKVGDLLATLDKTDAKNTLDKAKSNLALSIRNFVKSNNDKTSATSEMDIAKKDLQIAQEDLQRRNGLVAIGAISNEEYEHYKQRVTDAMQKLVIQSKNKDSAVAMVGNSKIENDPSIKLAETALKEAYINLKRCDIISPVNGIVAKKNIQIGQRLNIGQSIMAIVGTKNIWVDANIKETQLKNIRIGQNATIIVDAIGSDKKFDAKVVGISGGTGASFSILPAQNASGNWIKIVQRIPIRLSFVNKDEYKNALRVGLSAEVEIDTKNKNGGFLSSITKTDAKPFDPYLNADNESKVIIEKIIDENK